MTLDLTSFDAALKEYYTNDHVETLQFRDRPFLAYLAKSEKFPGRELPIPIQYADPGAISATFTTAQNAAAGASSQIKAFNLTRVKLYGFVNIDTETMEASQDSAGAWFEAQTNEIDNCIEGVSNVLATSLYRSGWGEVGVIGSSTGSTITLATLSDIYGIEVGQTHVFSSSLNAAVLRSSGATLTVTGVDRNLGKITYSAAVSTITGISNGDTIFIAGCRQDSATPSRIMPAGTEAWAPYGGVTSTSFFGVDRTVDSRLGGLYYNGASDAPEDAILQQASRMAAMGRTATHAFTSYGQLEKIAKNQRSLQRFVDKINANVSFEGITLLGPKGPIKLVGDQFCPATRAVVADMKVLKLHSIKKAVRVIDNDGLMYARLQTADGIQVRVGFKGNLGCNAPVGLASVNLTAA